MTVMDSTSSFLPKFQVFQRNPLNSSSFVVVATAAAIITFAVLSRSVLTEPTVAATRAAVAKLRATIPDSTKATDLSQPIIRTNSLFNSFQWVQVLESCDIDGPGFVGGTSIATGVVAVFTVVS
jgi:hypothetical protein